MNVSRLTKTISASLALLIAATLLPLALMGCHEDIPAETDPLPPEPVSLAGYTVVRPETCSDAVSGAAVELRKAVAAATGAETGIITDWTRDGSVPDTVCEIIVGVTSRPESITLSENLKKDDFIIKLCPNGRIVIVGGSDGATVAATDYFIGEYVPSGSVPAMLEYKSDGVYLLKTLVIDGAPVSEWNIILPSKPDADEKYAATLISDTVSKLIGNLIPIITEKADVALPDGRYILIGGTSLTPAEYRVEGEGEGNKYAFGLSDGNIVLSGEGGLTVRAARDLLSLMPDADNPGNENQELNVEVDNLSMREYSSPVYPAEVGLSGMPVALADQLNACVAVFDLAPVLTGEKPVKVWEFTPSSALGFSVANYGNRIDEARLRYSLTLGSYVVCITSSSGYMAVAKYPSRECVWNSTAPGYGPHSIEYLPDGNIIVACSGNGNEERACLRLYAASRGANAGLSDEAALAGAHAVLWDDVREIVWALGSSEIVAYSLGGTTASPCLEKIEGYGGKGSLGGHDLSPVYGNSNLLWVGGAGVWQFDKTLGTFNNKYPGGGTVTTKLVKCICNYSTGEIVRTVATNVYAAHDTDRLILFTVKDGVATPTEVVFADRAFYKARVFDPRYS